MGLQRREEVDAAISGIAQGKLTPREIDYLNLYGDLHRKQLKIQDVPLQRWLYRA